MDIPQYRFGPTTIAKITHSKGLKSLLQDPWLSSENIIVKPNWVSTDPGDYTDAETLRMLFETLTGRIIVTESYCLLRSMNLLKDGMDISIGDKKVNWKWLRAGEGWNWLAQNSDWDWFKREGHWEQLKLEDQAFRDQYGFTDLFNEFGVTYINVSEEVWSGRFADPSLIKRSVESQFNPIQYEKLHSMVPKALYNLRGSTLISFARLKMYASFTVKNLFGMIPDPLRPWWHGPDGSRIAQSIVDINKIYHSLFNVYGICEAINTTAYIHPEGQYKGLYTGRYNLAGGSGVVAFGRDLVSIDSILLSLSDPAKIWIADLNRDSIDLAEKEFGVVDRQDIVAFKPKVQDWISP